LSHLEKVIFVFLSQKCGLNTLLSTFASQWLVFSAQQSQVPQLVSPEDNQFYCSNREKAQFDQKLSDVFQLLGPEVLLSDAQNIVSNCFPILYNLLNFLDRSFSLIHVCDLLSEYL